MSVVVHECDAARCACAQVEKHTASLLSVYLGKVSMTDGREQRVPAEERLSLVLFLLEKQVMAMRKDGLLDDCSQAPRAHFPWPQATRSSCNYPAIAGSHVAASAPR